MKSFGCIVVLLTIFAATAFAAVAIGNYSDPKNPGKCTIKDNLVLSLGDKIKDPDAPCARIICGENGLAEFQSCGVTYIEGCKQGDYVDTSLKYPDCCKRIVTC